MLSTMTPTTESIVHAEFCPASSGSPKTISTTPNVPNSFATARLYFLISVTSNISAFAQNPIGFGFLENHVYTAQQRNIPPIIQNTINPIIRPSIYTPSCTVQRIQSMILSMDASSARPPQPKSQLFSLIISSILFEITSETT